MITFLYPEATRSRNGLLQKAPRVVGDNYYPKEKGDMYIFPIMGWGIEEVVRSDQTIKLGRTTLYTVFGKPFQVKELYEHDLSEIKLDKKPATPTDALMARLGKLVPCKVDPSLQEFYDTLARDYDPCIEDEFQTIPGIIERAMSLPQKFRECLSQVGLAVERIQRGD